MFAKMPRMPRAAEPRDGFTPFAGGLDRETPAWQVPPGFLRDALNYEIAVQNGYRDIAGYERFDGQASPSDASFTILDVTITGSIAVGDTVTGAVTGATGLVVAIATYPDDPDQYYLVLTKVTGTWDDAAENVLVAAAVEGTTDNEGYTDSAPTPQRKAQYKNLAADAYRADIGVVPGEGFVWGGFSLGNDKYAVRNKVGGATAGLYRATPAGWFEVSLGRRIAFANAGALPIEEGNTITGATSGATAVVRRVNLVSGAWGDNDATGWFIISGQTGTFVAENLTTGGELSGDSEAMTLAPDGRLDYALSNLANPRGSDRVYCADGVNPAWEYDGTYFAFIQTGMEDDTPSHVCVHKKHLFLSFDGSVQHSAPGDPFTWTVVTGALEIATGSPVTGFQVQPGSEGSAALLIACRQQFFTLYGNDVSDWNLVQYREKVGAYEWTLQSIAQAICLDDRGITDLRTAQEYGNFQHAAISNRISTLIAARRSLALSSCVVRNKNQYRLFFGDKTGVYVTMDGPRLLGMMPVLLGHFPVTIWSEENQQGEEEVFFGGIDGYVYQMERGTSFDGEPIYAFLETHFDDSRAREVMKGYIGPVTIEAKGTGYAELSLAYRLDYGRGEIAQPEYQSAAVPSSVGSAWDTGESWDTFVAFDDSSVVPTVGLDLRGEGRNINWRIEKNSDYFEPLLLSGVHYRFIPRVQTRG